MWGLALLIIMGCGVYLRLYDLGKLSLWNDEIVSVEYAKRGLADMFKNQPNMALYYAALHFWIKTIPNLSEVWLRLPSAIFSIISIWIIAEIGRTMGLGKRRWVNGLVAALLVAVNAFSVQYAQEVRAYSLVFVLTSLSTYLLIRAIDQKEQLNDSWWMWYVLVSVLAIYSYFFAIFILGAQMVSVLIVLIGKHRKFLNHEIANALVAIFALSIPIVMANVSKGSGEQEWIVKPSLETVKYFAFEISGKQSYLVGLFLAAIGAGLVGVIKKWQHLELVEKWKMGLITSCLVVPVVAMVGISVVIKPIFVDRYALFVMPYLALLVAVGIGWLIEDGWWGKLMGGSLLVAIIGLSLVGVRNYYQTFQKEDFRKVAELMEVECPGGLHLYYETFVQRRVAYYDRNLQMVPKDWASTLKTNLTAEQLAKYLPQGYSQACLVLSHNNSLEQRRTTKVIRDALLIRYGRAVQHRFYGIDVVVYELRD